MVHNPYSHSKRGKQQGRYRPMQYLTSSEANISHIGQSLPSESYGSVMWFPRCTVTLKIVAHVISFRTAMLVGLWHSLANAAYFKTLLLPMLSTSTSFAIIFCITLLGDSTKTMTLSYNALQANHSFETLVKVSEVSCPCHYSKETAQVMWKDPRKSLSCKGLYSTWPIPPVKL